MAISIAQLSSAGATGGGTSVTCTFSTGVATGNGIVVCIGTGNANISSVVDNAGNTYTLRRTANFFSATRNHIYDCLSATGNPTTITITVASSVPIGAIAYDINGTLTVNAGNAASGNTTTPAAGAITTTVADTIAIASMCGNTITAQPTGYTLDLNTQSTGAAHNVYTSTQTGINPTWTATSGGKAVTIEAYTSTNTGGTVYNKSVTSTLTLTQTINVTPVHNPTVVTSIATFGQTIGMHFVKNFSVQSTYTLIQDLSRNVNYVRTVSQTLTLTQQVDVIRTANTDVINTLNLTQQVDVFVIHSREIDQTITFTQTVTPQYVYQRSVTSTLTLTAEAHRIIEASADSTLTFTQTLSFQRWKIASTSHTLTFTQTVTANKTSNKRIDSNIFLTQSIGLNKTLNKTVTNTLSLSQSLSVIASKLVKNTLTLTQTVNVDLVKRTGNFLDIYHIVSLNTVLNRPILSLMIPYQVIDLNILSRQTVTSTLGFTQTITADKVKGIAQSLTFTQTVVGTASKAVKNTLHFTQSIHVNISRNVAVTNTLRLTQSIGKNLVKFFSIQHALGIDQFIKQRRGYVITVQDTLPLTQELYRERFTESITNTLALTQSVVVQPIRHLSILSNLPLTQILSKQVAFSLSITSNLEFYDNYPRFVGGIEIEVPTILVAKAQRFTSLSYGAETIILPNPQFGDGQGNTGLFTLRRGWRGKSYTYVKKTDFQKVTYTFYLSLKKSLELEGFLAVHNSDLLEMRNWKGEIWRVFVTNNPVEFHHAGRWEPCDRERVEVTLEFEGIRLGATNYDQPANPNVTRVVRVRR